VKRIFKAAMAGLLTATIAGAGVVALAGTAFAAPSAPAWEYDANATAPYGNITFYDAAGDQVTSGTNLASPFAYAVAGTNADTNATNASLAFANPTHGESPTLWTSSYAGGPTTFSPATSLPTGTPADVVAFAPTYPVVAAGASASITSWLTSNTPDTTAGYANIIEVRLTDSGAHGHTAPGFYWESDIAYNTTASAITVDGTTVPANGWAELFPFVTPTTLTVTTSATGGNGINGTAITLTATSSVNAQAGDAVQFFDNGTFLALVSGTVGSPTYTYNYTPANNSTNVYTADYIPGDAPGDETGAYTTSATIVGGSVASGVTVVYGPPRINTSITLSTSNASIAYGASVTFTSTVTPTAAAGTVEFFSGVLPITGCTAVAVNPPASATCTTTTLPAGTDNITAQFTPTSTTTYNGITSSVVVETVAAPVICNLPGSICSDTQNITVTISPGTITVSTPYTATNPFKLPNLALSNDGTYLTSSATFPATGGANASTTTTGTVADVTTLSGATLNVTSTTGFAPQGTITVVTSSGSAELTYTGVTPTSFTGVAYSAGAGSIATGGNVFGPNPQAIVVTSTASPAYAWTLSVAATALTSGANSIPASGLGLTNGTLLNATGPGAYPGTVNFGTGIPALNPSPVDGPGTGPGLSTTPQTWATSSAADGTAEMNGTLTLLAATSTPAGTYSGTVTFSVS
jgi:hypothetical protein